MHDQIGTSHSSKQRQTRTQPIGEDVISGDEHSVATRRILKAPARMEKSVKTSQHARGRVLETFRVLDFPFEPGERYSRWGQDK